MSGAEASGDDRGGARLRQAVILVAYGVAFTLVRHLAASWSTLGLFSLWFPAAGVRFAFLWWRGARIAPWAALSELLVQVAEKPARFADDPLLSAVGVIGPCLVYGAVIAVAQRLAARTSRIEADPLPFALASVVGPAAASVSALPWAIPLATTDGVLSAKELASAMLVFSLGDMLGIFTVAPALLWLFDPETRARRRWTLAIKPSRWLEVVAIVVLSFLLVVGLRDLGYGALRGPILLASWWAALRTGRLGAWLASLATCLFFLPQSEHLASVETRIGLHMMLVTNAAGAFVIGAYAEAQDALRRQIERRDRLLRRADRLKQVRAMSIAVIHEISQPLSTLSLEADNLLDQLDRGECPEATRATAQLLARKAEDLSDMVRRLRQFGSDGGDLAQPVAVRSLVEDAIQLAAAESGFDRLMLSPGEDLLVEGSDLELRQALLNLVRNALRASQGAETRPFVAWHRVGSRVEIVIDNAVVAPGGRGGLGIGLVIARSIVEAHGGSIALDGSSAGRMRARMSLPLARDEA